MEKATFLTFEEEAKSRPLFISGRDELEQLYYEITEKRKKIKLFCDKNPKIAAFIKDMHNRTSLYEEAWDFANLEKNIREKNKSDFLDDFQTSNRTGFHLIDPSSEANPESILSACNIVSHCARRNAEDTIFSFDLEQYYHLGESLLVKAHDEMFNHMNPSEKKLIAKKRFRNASDPLIVVPSAPFEPVRAEEVSSRMSSFFISVRSDWEQYNPIERAALVTAELWRIQPFMDGNKRIALLAANFILEQAGVNRVVLPKSQANAFMDNMRHTILSRDGHNLAKQYSNIILGRQDKTMEKIREKCLAERLGPISNDEFGS